MSNPTAEQGADRDRALLQRTAAELTRKFSGKLPADLVEHCLNEAYDTIASTASIRIYLVATATRLARNKLTALAQATNDITIDNTHSGGALSGAYSHPRDKHNDLDLHSQPAVPAKVPA